ITELRQCCSCGGSSQAGPDYNDIKLPLIGRIDQLDVVAMVAPLLTEWSARNLSVEFHNVFFATFAVLCAFARTNSSPCIKVLKTKVSRLSRHQTRKDRDRNRTI